MKKSHSCCFRYTKKDIKKAASTEPQYMHVKEERLIADNYFKQYVDNLDDSAIADKIRCELNLYEWEAYIINDELQIQRFDGKKWIILNKRTGNSYYYDLELRGYIEIIRLEEAPSRCRFYADDYELPLLSKCCFNVFKICSSAMKTRDIIRSSSYSNFSDKLPKGWYLLESKLPEYKNVVKACFIPLSVLVRIKKKAARYSFTWEYKVDVENLCCVKYISSYYVFKPDMLKNIHSDYISMLPKFLKLPDIYKIDLPTVYVAF
jgi:hypothetical protein